ncbi:MAG: DMT family transporter [Clostridia bacterium]|nr:DMT family transporter [Clostridia bacterium]
MSNFNKKAVFADVLLILVALIWGGGFVVIKDSLSAMTPLFLMAIRFDLAAIVLGVIFYRQMKQMTMDDLKPGIAIGLFLFIAFAVQNVGLNETTASANAFLTATNVVFVPFLVWFYRRQAPKLSVFIASGMTLAGVGLMTLNENLAMGRGDVLSLIGAFFFAVHIIFVDKYAKERSPMVLTFIQIAAAGIFMTLSAFIIEPVPEVISSKVWIGLVYQVLLGTVVCYGLQNSAQKHTSSSHTSIILSLEAFFATVMAVIFLKEQLTLPMIAGSFLIFASILLVEIKPTAQSEQSAVDTAPNLD